jgi:hypothetical protein
MKFTSFALSFGLALTLVAGATTHAVLPGKSIQAKIDLAVAGDIVAIFGGTYNEDLTINKAIRLVEVSGQNVTITGNVTFTGVTDCPPFDGFTVGSAGRGVTVTNTTGLVLRNLDARAGSGVTSGGTSSLSITGGQLSQLNHTGGSMQVNSVVIVGNFETQTSAQKTVAFRTTVAGDCVWRSKRNWFGYSEARSFNFQDQNEAKVVVVGNKIDRQGGEANGIYSNVSNSSILITNNRVVRVGYNWSTRGDGKCGIDLRGGGNAAVIANNFCQLQYSADLYGREEVSRGEGIYVRDFTQATIINNVIVGARYGISAPFGVLAQNNLYWASPWNGSFRETNGVVAEATLYTDPLFVAGEEPKLQAASPCINAGTPDPRYNDRDGSRNDIGPSGGAWFDPDGWTTENPVVISFDLSPDLVLEGVDTEVILSEGQAVSAP